MSASHAPTVAAAVVQTHPLDGTNASLPLVIEPADRASRGAASLLAWMYAERDPLRRLLTHHGALLLRGFAVEDAATFEAVARAVDPALKNDYLGTSPRNAITDYVFSASELPPYYPIPQHCEMSFTLAPPVRLFFWCQLASTGPGGETPLVDMRTVLRDLDPAVRARFEERGVRNIRNYVGPEGGSRFDLWKLKRWDEMFGTTDRGRVEAICGKEGFACAWKAGGRLQLANTQPAIKRHPITGEPAWFNHSQVFHLSSVPAEYAYIARRLGGWRYRGLHALARALVTLKRRTSAVEDQAMHCTFGDGGEIGDGDMDKVREAIWKNLVFPKWQTGDVVMIDNDAVAHGRMPYRGPRRVAVAWA